jgi:quinol-cytochrome oxidoreductase complex cytochrome b subunit
MNSKSMRAVSTLLGAAWLLVGLQVLVGVALSSRYKATLEAAHASISSLERSTGWGFVAAFHYWASAATIVTLILFLGWMLFGGHVRRENRWMWWCGLVLFGLVLALQVTGNALPASQHDVRTVNIEAGIAGGVPNVGPAMRSAVLGGDQFAQATLDRWYMLHRFILPLALLVVTLGGLMAARRLSWKITVLGALIPPLAALSFAAIFGLPLGPQATAADFTAAATQPMWYVYPSHAMLMGFGRLAPGAQWVGAMLIPAILGLILFALPLISKNGNVGRWLGGTAALGILLACAFAGTPVQNIAREDAVHSQQEGAGDFGPIDKKMAIKGEGVFLRENCMSCHRLGNKGKSDTGPNLAKVGSRISDPKWYIGLLKDPASKNRSTMPAFGDLSQSDSRELAEYLRSLK